MTLLPGKPGVMERLEREADRGDSRTLAGSIPARSTRRLMRFSFNPTPQKAKKE